MCVRDREKEGKVYPETVSYVSQPLRCSSIWIREIDIAALKEPGAFSRRRNKHNQRVSVSNDTPASSLFYAPMIIVNHDGSKFLMRSLLLVIVMN